MKVLRFGHLRSAPVVVDATYTHGVGTAYTPCSVVGLHALRRLLHGFLPLLRRANASREESRRFVDGVADQVTDSMLSSWQSRTSRSFSVLRQDFTTDPEVHERIRGSSGWQMTYSFCPHGLWVSMRYPVCACTRLSGGLHRRSGVILDRSSANFFGTRYRLGK